MAEHGYPEEEQYLEDTVEFIDREVERLKRKPPDHAAHSDTARRLKEMDDARLAHLEAARPRPYFGRVDFLRAADGSLTEAYIGTGGIADGEQRYVYDWRAPFPGKVFYADPRKRVAYEAPGGLIEGRITLKRQYAIDDARLEDVTEVYRSLPAPAGVPAIDDASENFMVRQLSGRRTGELQQAVATLQPDQYQQVAASAGQVMLLQGVAGSGKSIVGLHRIAYLLSPLHGENEQIDEARVVIFGPSRTFLRYVANLLPSIDVHNVRQVTVRDWLEGTLSERIVLREQVPLLEKLLRDRGGNWSAAERAARCKGSLQMTRALERHVRDLRKRFIAASTDVVVTLGPRETVTLPSARVRRVARGLADAPLNSRRAQLIERLARELQDEARRKRVDAAGTLTVRAFTEAARPLIDAQVAAFWPSLDVRQEYRRLLSAPDALGEASGGAIEARDAAAVAASLQRLGPTVFAPDDLGPLCYLDHLLNERPNERFEHVVLDEAQEVSVAELLVIRRHSRNDSFTILGDLTQSLSPQGIDRWREVLQLFRGIETARYIARTSYRSTYEITRFANRLLKQADRGAMTAVPFARRGSRPTFTASESAAGMVEAIANDVRELEGRGTGSIGVLCKTTQDARRVHEQLLKHGIEAGLLTSNETPQQRTVVAPIHVTRGLEYDAVILAGASSEQYPATPLHSKLLYVGASRAAHELRIHWTGQPATQLGVRKPASPRAKRRR